jgi:hypothetical protein
VASADEAGEDDALILRGALDAGSATGALAFATACGALAAISGCVLGEQACCW